MILTYYWPPGSGPGVQRWLKFCKYLPEYGWQPTVITVKNGSYPYEDVTLVDDVPTSLRVLKTDTFEPFRMYNLLRGKKGKQVEVAMGSIKGTPSLFSRIANYIRSNYFIPDARVGWNKYALRAAIREIELNKPDLIITTGPPHSTHLVGLKLKSLYQIPWIADFRDPWTTIYYNALLKRTNSSIRKDQNFENEVVKKADILVVTTPGMKEEFADRSSNIETIPNGYDEEDFEEVNLKKEDENFRLAYIGNLKENQNLPALWKAIKSLSEDINFKSKFRLCLTGSVHQSIRNDIQNQGISDLVEYHPFVEHKTAVRRMQNSDCLLLPIPVSTRNHVILTGKLFEYLASRRPILAIGPIQGNASQILNECQHSPMLDYADQKGIEAQVKSLFDKAEQSGLCEIVGNDNYLKYSRKGLALFLSETMIKLQP